MFTYTSLSLYTYIYIYMAPAAFASCIHSSWAGNASGSRARRLPRLFQPVTENGKVRKYRIYYRSG